MFFLWIIIIGFFALYIWGIVFSYKRLGGLGLLAILFWIVVVIVAAAIGDKNRTNNSLYPPQPPIMGNFDNNPNLNTSQNQEINPSNTNNNVTNNQTNLDENKTNEQK